MPGADISGESGLLNIENGPAQRGLKPPRKLVGNMNNPPVPDLKRESGRLFVSGVVEDANVINAALGWIESNRQVGYAAFVNAAKSGLTCRVTAATCAPFHAFDVTVEAVKRNINHKDTKAERSGKLGLLERDRAPQRCFQGE